MDSKRDKEINIDVKNVSLSNDNKKDEVSLAEVENDDGYQYIQIKNSETFNNTKGFETENANDGILFKKLNETETTTTKDINEETFNPDSINDTNNIEDYQEEKNYDNSEINNNDNFDYYNNSDNEDKDYYNNKNSISKQNDFDGNNKNYNYDQNINVNNYLRDNPDGSTDQSERELFEKVIIRNETPYEELTSENYSISACPKVTTVKFEGETFSYLTNPTNDENFFFVKLNTKKNIFEICGLDEYKQKHLDTTRIPYNQLISFLTEMNMGLDGLNKDIKGKRFIIRFWNFIKFFAAFSLLFIVNYLLFSHGEKFFSISANANKNIFYGCCLISFLFLIFLLYSLIQDLTVNYEVCKIYLDRQKELEDVIEKWNQDYFGPNLNMNCSIPYTYPYIQITLQPNLLIYLEEHEIFDF